MLYNYEFALCSTTYFASRAICTIYCTQTFTYMKNKGSGVKVLTEKVVPSRPITCPTNLPVPKKAGKIGVV